MTPSYLFAFLCLSVGFGPQESSEWRIAYSEDGLGLGVVAPDGRTMRYRWTLDDGGRLADVKASYGQESTTRWTFDASGRRVSMKDQEGRKIRDEAFSEKLKADLLRAAQGLREPSDG